MEISKGKEADEKENNNIKTLKGKSCKGCLYYSSSLQSKASNPICVGISRSVQVQAHGYIVGESEMEASKEGRNLSDFKYGCLGYSMYLNSKDSTTNTQETRAVLLACIIGLEYQLLVDKKAPAPATLPENVSAPVLNKEDGARVSPPLRTPKPTSSSSTRDDFQTRFTRNARLVASGVANNLIKVGNRVKENLEDMLYPYRSKPK